jgi:hypothetical protein
MAARCARLLARVEIPHGQNPARLMTAEQFCELDMSGEDVLPGFSCPVGAFV